MWDKIFKIFEYITEPTKKQLWAAAILVFMVLTSIVWQADDGGFMMAMKFIWMSITIAGYVILAVWWLRGIDGLAKHFLSECAKMEQTKSYKEFKARSDKMEISKWKNFVWHLEFAAWVVFFISLAVGTAYLISLALGGLGLVMWGVLSVGFSLLYVLLAAIHLQKKFNKELNNVG